MQNWQLGEFTILFSAVIQEELELAPEPGKELVRDLRTDQTEFLELDGNSVELAQEYISEKVTGQTSYVFSLKVR